MRDIKKYSKTLYKSIQRELARRYAFGCVTYQTKGSHDDMDSKLFEKSALAICTAMDATDWQSIDDFYDLRAKGLLIENAMFEATSGVNTHKGLIFLNTFLALAYVRGILRENLEVFITEFSKDLVNDYDKEEKAIIWESKGLADIRYYPLTGFRDIIKLVEEEKENQFDDLILTLKLIATIDDTTTVMRSSVISLWKIQKSAKSILKMTDSEVFERKVKDLDNYYIENNISSGGVADLFTTIVTLKELKEDFDD